MPRPKASTRRTQIRPLGVSERLGDAPPSHYRYSGTGRPAGSRTYTVAGIEHRFDGTCHDTCEDVR